MKMRTLLICLFVFFVIVLFLGRVSAGGGLPQRVDFNYAISLTLGTAGGLIAVIGLFKVLIQAFAGERLEKNVPFVPAILGGVLLYQSNWGVALALGILATAAVSFPSFRGPKNPES